MRKGSWPLPPSFRAAQLSTSALLVTAVCAIGYLGYLLACSSGARGSLLPGQRGSLLLWQQPQQGKVEMRGQEAQQQQQHHPQPLLMFMKGRTGSSFITEVLNLHPRVIFQQEIHNDAFKWQGNKPAAEKFFVGAYRPSYENYRSRNGSYSTPAKNYDQLAVVGFKVRPATAELYPGSEGWRVLQRVRPKIICSYRRNSAKTAISEMRAKALDRLCNTANLSRHVNCTLPSNWTASPQEFEAALHRHYNGTRDFLEVCFRAAEEWPTIFVAYEDLIADVPLMVGRMLRFAGIQAPDRLPFIEAIRKGTLPIALDKNTPDDLQQVLPAEMLAELAKLTAQVVGNDAAASLYS